MRPDLATIKSAIDKAGGFRPAERLLRSEGYEISERSIRRALAGQTLDYEAPDFEVDPEPSFDIEALIEQRRQVFQALKAKQDYDRQIPVRVNVDGPIGIGFMGDPHIDDDGTDIDLLMRHADVFDGRNRGLFAACLGDAWNNWVGRLNHLWSQQTTDAEQARALIRHFLSKVHWLFYIQGNHDLWAGNSNILDEILAAKNTVNRAWRARVGIKLPAGKIVKIYAAHRFPGSSQIVEQMGVIKKAKADGQHDIYVGADKHIAGYSLGKHGGTQKIYHAVQIGAYKRIDAYADELNAEDLGLYQCPVALVDPYATDEINFIRFEFDPEEAAERLKWMRSRWASGKSAS